MEDGVLIVRADDSRTGVRVERGQLVIDEGAEGITRIAPHAGLRRLVLVGTRGYLTLPAIRWLSDVGCRLVHLDGIGRLTSVSQSDAAVDARVLRAQALLPYDPAAVGIMRELVRRKLEGQMEVLRELGSVDVRRLVGDLVPLLDRSQDGVEIRSAEARAGNLYWEAWSTHPVRWVRADERRIPEEWRRVGRRTSVLTGSPQSATSPAQVMANYLYACARAECTAACVAYGLSPDLGVLHPDEPGRQSLALDVLEALRPDADRILLSLLRTHSFRVDDFLQLPDGSVRSLPRLNRQLAQSVPHFSGPALHVARWVAGEIRELVPRLAWLEGRTGRLEKLNGIGAGSVEEVLARTSTAAGNEPRALPGRRSRRAPPAPRGRFRLPAQCGVCGAALTGKRRVCDDCLAGERKRDLQAAQARLRELRRGPEDPKAMKRRHNKDRQEENREWERVHGLVTEEHRREYREVFWPQLRRLPLSLVLQTAGLSPGSRSRVRQGGMIHPSRWPRLRELLQAEEMGAVDPNPGVEGSRAMSAARDGPVL